MCPILGGNWNNGASAGAWALNLNNVRANSNDSVGFRSDSAKLQSAIAHSRAKGDTFRLQAKSELICLFGSNSILRSAGLCENQAKII